MADRQQIIDWITSNETKLVPEGASDQYSISITKDRKGRDAILVRVVAKQTWYSSLESASIGGEEVYVFYSFEDQIKPA